MAVPATETRRLTESDCDAFGRLMASAFDDGAAYRAIFPSGDLAYWFSARLFIVLRNGGLALGAFEKDSGTLLAAGCTSPPGADPSTWLQLRAGLLWLPWLYGWGSLRRLIQVAASDKSAVDRWHIQMVAVSEKLRGGGMGSALMHNLFAEIAEDTPEAVRAHANAIAAGAAAGVVGYDLRTQTEGGRRFYERLGFTLTAELTHPMWGRDFILERSK
jgi:ribosomal protein S18 acetylase RimI-like enzyme